MTRVTATLKTEHRVIEQVLDCLELIAEGARRDGRLDRESAADVVRFVRGFADGVHHGKEEDKLFPAMIGKGVPGDVGPIGVMLSEHETGRAAVREMDTIVSDAQGSPEAFARIALEFVDHLRNHILKEDNILFPMADSVLSEEEQAKLVDGACDEDERAELIALADTLAGRLGVSPATERTTQPFQGCCHQHAPEE
jgi:hemerythrin-like domain-containing protein